MTQMLAMFVDAYRELNSRRMFWISIILSGMFVLAFAMFGVEPRAITFLKWRFEQPLAEVFYKAILLKFLLIDVWLTWAATIIALISTASIFPDFLAGGSVDLYLSKPISRSRLFLLKYVTGLLFATLQVAVVMGGIFFVVGFRLSQWRPSLLMGIPIVVCFYSYLYVVSVFFGVLTRSTITALILTLLAWVAFYAINKCESQLLMFKYAQESRVARFEGRIADEERRALRTSTAPSFAEVFTGRRTQNSGGARPSSRQRRDEAGEAARSLAGVHRVVYGVLTVLPKTGPTVDLLNRYVLRDREAEEMMRDEEPSESTPSFGNSDESVMFDVPAQAHGMRKAARDARSRSLWWVLGPSLGLEAVCLALATWVFCRRDY